MAADLGEAFARLDGCGADAELVALARHCLAAQAADRPRDAGAVAAAVTTYQRSVQERLRQAELGRARAQVQAAEERKRRRLTLALAAAVLLALLGVGVGAYWQQRQRARADLAVGGGLAQAELLAAQAREAPLQADRYRQAVEAARVAAELAEGASADVRQRAQELLARLQAEEEEAGKDRALLAELLDVRSPREGPKYQIDAQGLMLALAEPTADEQFAAAFRRWGLDVDGTAAAEAEARLKARPAAVVAEVVAALDEWAGERRRQGRPAAEWRRPAELAALLDDDPGSKRRELREILARGRLPLERALDVLSATLRPVPVPVEVPLGPDRARLRQLAEQTDPAAEPALGLLTLSQALGEAGEGARAERLLRAAVVARPRVVVLHHALGQLLAAQDPPRWAEAVECFAAARVARPELGANLALALRRSGRDGEGLALLARLVSERPASPYLHSELAHALYAKGKVDETIGHYEQALRLDPKYAKAHNDLGLTLYDCGRPVEAIRHYEEALRLDPKDAEAHNSLGTVLHALGKADEAVSHFEEAIRLDPKLARAHGNLGNVLSGQGKLEEAIRHHEEALRLDPKDAKAHMNLGFALKKQGKLTEAIRHYEQALHLDPKYAWAHYNLGLALSGQGKVDEAIRHYEEALRLDPKAAKAHAALGGALLGLGRWAEARDATRRCLGLLPPRHPLRPDILQLLQRCERMLALEAQLPAVLQGKDKPAGAAECLEFVGICQATKRYAAAARFYADAFAADPKAAEDVHADGRYNAACFAALAAAGQGTDTPKPDDKERTRLRGQALGWLRADLALWQKQADSGQAESRATAQRTLRHWQHDPDLAGVRGKEALVGLPAQERAEWEKLWAEVADLLRRLDAGKPAAAPAGK
jgi:tetratricopeptide (TPR) repeat protein